MNFYKANKIIIFKFKFTYIIHYIFVTMFNLNSDMANLKYIYIYIITERRNSINYIN